MFTELATAIGHAAAHLFSWLPGAAGHDPIWTFAYGANMGSAKLHALGVHPTETLKGVLPHHELIFDSSLRDGPAEPSFANIRHTEDPFYAFSVSPVQDG
eukprot:g28615.t1